MENSMKVPQKLKNRPTIRSSNSSSGYLSKESKNTNTEKDMQPMFIVALCFFKYILLIMLLQLFHFFSLLYSPPPCPCLPPAFPTLSSCPWVILIVALSIIAMYRNNLSVHQWMNEEIVYTGMPHFIELHFMAPHTYSDFFL